MVAMSSSSIATAPRTATERIDIDPADHSTDRTADESRSRSDAAAPDGGRRRGFLRRTARPRRQALRQHGQAQPFDRRELENSGWRTTLEYRENHGRGRDGRLECLEVVWHAEAERVSRNGTVRVVSAVANTQARAWSRLRAAADLADVKARRSPVASP